MSRIKGKFLAVGALTLAAFAVAPMAQAEQGDWLFKAGATMVSPKSDNLKADDGEGNVLVFNVDDGTSLGLTLSYMFTDNWAVELLAAVPFKHDIKVGIQGVPGSVKIAETKHLPPTLSIQYHFMPDGTFNPYVGVGFNWTLFSSEKFTAAEFEGASLTLEDSTGFAAQVGIDWYFTDKWFANLDVRYIDLSTKAKVTLDGTTEPLGDVAIDPMVYSLMIGYRF